MTFAESVVRAARGVPRGSVVSYSQLAARAGHPGAARAAGSVLAGDAEVPWWRIVRADGRLASHKVDHQAALLAAEGVAVAGGRVTDPALRAGLARRALD